MLRLLIALFLAHILIVVLTFGCPERMWPQFDASRGQYLSCNPWEPDCPDRSSCQLANNVLKKKLNFSDDYFLYLCCGGSSEETLRSGQAVSDEEANVAPSVETRFSSLSSTRVGNLSPSQSQSHLPPTITPLLPEFHSSKRWYNISPKVTQLVVGNLTAERHDGTFKMCSSSTLVQDSEYNLLIDTSCAANRNSLLGALAQRGIKPEHVHILVNTKYHPAHSANEHLFPNAQKIFSSFVYKGDDWVLLKQLEEPRVALTRNVELWQTPGRSYLHISAVIRNVPASGSVVVSGDVFVNEASFRNMNTNEWKRFAVDVDLLAQSRNMLVCQSDFVIPAYGHMFKAPAQYRNTLSCGVK